MKATMSLPPAEECNCFAARAVARRLSQSYDRFLAPSGLRITQLSLLTRLKRNGSLTINALADDMVMDRTTLGRNVLPLQRDGLITIKPAASDRRAKVLRLTDAGEQRLQAAREGWSRAKLNLRPRLERSALPSCAHFCAPPPRANSRPGLRSRRTGGRCHDPLSGAPGNVRHPTIINIGKMREQRWASFGSR